MKTDVKFSKLSDDNKLKMADLMSKIEATTAALEKLDAERTVAAEVFSRRRITLQNKKIDIAAQLGSMRKITVQ